MPDFPWYIWAAIGAVFVLFIWPMLNAIIFGVIDKATGGGQKAQGA